VTTLRNISPRMEEIIRRCNWVPSVADQPLVLHGEGLESHVIAERDDG
jgi:hypothetical protein